MVEPYLNQVGGKVDNDVSLFTGGLNTYQDKAFLESNQMPYVMNMSMYKPPMMCTRPARKTLITSGHGDNWTLNIGTIVDMYAFDQSQIFVITDVESGGVVSRNLVNVYIPAGGTEYQATTLITVPTENNYYFTTAQDRNFHFVYLTGLTFKIKILIHPTDPTLTTALAISDGHYGICCYHKHRLFLATPGSNLLALSAAGNFDNFDDVVNYAYIPNPSNPVDLTNANKSYVYLTDYDDTSYTQYKYNENLNVWDEQADKLPKANVWIDPDTNVSIPDYSVLAGEYKVWNTVGNIVSLKSFDDKLMIFCEHSMHCLYGDTPDTTKQNQFQFVDLNNNLGCHSHRCVAVGGGRLFWLGDDYEVYEYTGSAINIVSRPGKTRNSTLAVGGISNIFAAEDDIDYRYKAQMAATANKLFFNVGLFSGNEFLFVFDIYNRTWWCEDGEFSSIANYSSQVNKIIMARNNGDIVRNYERMSLWQDDTADRYYDFEIDDIVGSPINYEFHTRVYGADGTDLRKTLSNVWFQARATATVYINDIWTTHDKWGEILGHEDWFADIDANYREIGTLKYEQQSIEPETRWEKYRPNTYEQQVCYVEKMYGQRLNAFQIIVKGTGRSKFYLMKREWRAR